MKPAKTFPSTLTEVETQMHYEGPTSDIVVLFRSPHPDTTPFYMPSEKWERMGRPHHIRVRVKPVYANGQPWHED